MYELLIYDTSNFTDFPMGGQLTSIRNFLKYIAACHPEDAEKILLVGITTKPGEAGTLRSVEVDRVSFDFLPVLYRGEELSHVRRSLRLDYVRALLGRNGRIPCLKNAVHYIHTPEAYIAVKLRHPGAKTAVFSHGSFFNMVQGFRFFQKNKLVHRLFDGFLVVLLKTADLIFVLDDAAEAQYRKYTPKICRVENSIVLPEKRPDRAGCRKPVRLLYAGRLSRVKGLEGLILAMEQLAPDACLTIVGDGEERKRLETLVEERQLGSCVTLAGGCAPSRMEQYYQDSDILVMNSVLEGKPMTILEAMSHGLPVITTPVGGIPELVRSGREGEFTDGSLRQIREAVNCIAAEYESYAQHAAARASCYDYRAVNRRILEELRKLT